MKKVLLFGSTGAVGKGCLEVLTRLDDLSLVLVGRDEARLREAAAGAVVETAKIDATDATAVTAAARQCDVVINCAGPSQQISAQVAGAAIAAGVPYVDPGGDQRLVDRLTAMGTTVPVVLQAGVQPGLSGLLLRVIASHRTGEVDRITAWCGGLQRLTPASVLEYLASLRDTHSHPGAALCDGAIRRIGRAECKAAPAQYFPRLVSVHAHLDAETVSVAEYLGIDNICWMNVFDGAHATRAMQLLAVDDERSCDVNTAIAAAKLDLFGRQTYFTTIATAQGRSGATTVAFTCPDSYRVTGALAAFAAGRIADMPAGIHPFWRIDQPRHALEFVAQAVPEVELSFADDLAPTMIEEGSL